MGTKEGKIRFDLRRIKQKPVRLLSYPWPDWCLSAQEAYDYVHGLQPPHYPVPAPRYSIETTTIDCSVFMMDRTPKLVVYVSRD